MQSIHYSKKRIFVCWTRWRDMKIYHVALSLMIIIVAFSPVLALSDSEIEYKAEQLISRGEQINEPTIIEIDDIYYHIFIISQPSEIKYIVFNNNGDLITDREALKPLLYFLNYNFVNENSEELAEHSDYVDRVLLSIQVEDEKTLDARIEKTAQNMGREFKDSISSISLSIWENIVIKIKFYLDKDVEIYADAFGRGLASNAENIVISAATKGEPILKATIILSKSAWNMLRSESNHIKKAQSYKSNINGLTVKMDERYFEKSETEIVLFNIALYRLPKILRILKGVTNDEQSKEILEEEYVYFEDIHEGTLNLYSSANTHLYNGENMQQVKINEFEIEHEKINANFTDLIDSIRVEVNSGKDIHVGDSWKVIRKIKGEMNNPVNSMEDGYYNDAIDSYIDISEKIAIANKDFETAPILIGWSSDINKIWNQKLLAFLIWFL